MVAGDRSGPSNVIRRVYTDPTDGSFTINNLEPGNYQVSICYYDPDHRLFNVDYSPYFYSTDSGRSQCTKTVVEVTPDERIMLESVRFKQNDFTFSSSSFQVSVASIGPQVDLGALSGHVIWDDDDSKTVSSPDERIPGHEVVISRNGVEVARTATDENGFYRVERLIPGDYTISVTTPGGGTVNFTDEKSTVPSGGEDKNNDWGYVRPCLLYTSDAADE